MRIGLTSSYQVHDSLQVAGRLTATLAEHAAEQRPDPRTLIVLQRLQRHEAAA